MTTISDGPGRRETRLHMAECIEAEVRIGASVELMRRRSAGHTWPVELIRNQEELVDGLLAAAAELRKTCATCEWWEHYDGPACGKTIAMPTPEDGSGFCHRWEGKP